MTLDGYLPCTGIKKGYFDASEFTEWLQTNFIPAINATERFPMIVILYNVGIHTGPEVREIIENAGHLIRYLPLYSPDFNPIELTFAVLKSWMKRN
jgi:transposase